MRPPQVTGTTGKGRAKPGREDRDARRQASRGEKWNALRALWDVSTLGRVRKCRKVSMIEDGEVHVRQAPDGTVSYAGLTTCGSVWACPLCSAKIARERAEELTKLIEWNVARGGSVALLTLTMRHHRGQTLKQLRKALTGAWRHITSSRGWKDSKKQRGMDYVRAIETTHRDANGWHVHAHVLLVFPRQIEPVEAAELEAELWDRWETALASEGMTALREHGVDLRVGEFALETLAGYINKLAFEAVGGRWKKAGGGGRTPFQVLADFLATGNADDFDVWAEWEQGSKGMQQLVWSNGLKDRVGLRDKKDEEIAAETQEAETLAVLPASTWRVVQREADVLLDAAEDAPETAYRWLDARGLRYDHLERRGPATVKWALLRAQADAEKWVQLVAMGL